MTEDLFFPPKPKGDARCPECGRRTVGWYFCKAHWHWERDHCRSCRYCGPRLWCRLSRRAYEARKRRSKSRG